MLVFPAATPVTGTGTEDTPAANGTLEGAVASAVLATTTLAVYPPAGAGADTLSVKLAVAPAFTDNVGGAKVKVTVTVINELSAAYWEDGSLPVTTAVPNPTPV